ncbi:hypothetical protein HELRODRAFT_74170, partial [Helobdella robusta]|uniref:P/Homo B domain-containing protein n=1 Tax=Helobdella robusta TaxID=6412 RepID=T1G1M9_HELRO
HGTRCAGQIAAVANNKKCIVGVAFKATIGGIRMLQEVQTDAQEAHALSFKPNFIDIYSNSWGPNDGGKIVDGPKTLTQTALLKGVTEGRRGKGSIFIWASGNGGGGPHDSCGADGYASSMYTISISGVTDKNTKPFFLEKCSSTLASAYSGGDQIGMQNIVTTDIRNQCGEHTGTSSSAPIAAALCALALQANPDLTWRDMQHIIVETSRTEPLKDAKWVTNGAGKLVSHMYGFGLMDGLAMTQLAEQWRTVPKRHTCVGPYHRVDKYVPFQKGINFNITTNGCEDVTDDVINYLEHVQVVVWLEYDFRGYLQITLESPAGTQSTLMYPRDMDYLKGAFSNWTFMSVFYWGENPRGTWKLNVTNVGLLIGNGQLFVSVCLVVFCVSFLLFV